MRQKLIRTEPAVLIVFSDLIDCDSREQKASKTVTAIGLIGADAFVAATACDFGGVYWDTIHPWLWKREDWRGKKAKGRCGEMAAGNPWDTRLRISPVLSKRN